MSPDLEAKLLETGKLLLDTRRRWAVKDILDESDLTRASKQAIRKRFYEAIDRGEPFDLAAVDEMVAEAHTREIQEQQAQTAALVAHLSSGWQPQQLESQLESLAVEYAGLVGSRHCESYLRQVGLRIGAGVLGGHP
jgi:hypothetical protein